MSSHPKPPAPAGREGHAARVDLSPAALREIRGRIAEGRARVAGGLLLGRREGGCFHVARAVASPNRAADPTLAFRVDPAAVSRVSRALHGTGLAIIGTFHGRTPTRPDAFPVPGAWLRIVGGAGESPSLTAALEDGPRSRPAPIEPPVTIAHRAGCPDV